MLKRNSKLLDRKLYQYLLPSFFMVLAMQFGSLADGIIVGNLISDQALTASSLVMPILFIIQLPGFAIGTGGAIAVGAYLGKRETEKASKTFSICMIAGVGASAVFALLAPVISAPLASLYLPTELCELGRRYIFVYLVTNPVITLALLLSFFISTDNSPRIASAFFVVSNIVKVGSEVLFISAFKMDMYGAALSTAAGYAVGMVAVVFYIRSDKRMLSFSLKIKGSARLLGESVRASMTSALNMILTAVQMSVANIIIANVVTDPALQAVFGVMANFVFGFDLLVGGINQLIPTVCAVFYGEEDYFSLRAAARRLYFLTIIVTAALTGILMINPGIYCKMFGVDVVGDEYFAIMRVYLLAFIPYELNKFSMSYYPSIGKNTPSMITVALREAVLVLPLTISMLYANGLMGYAMSQFLTELFTLILTYAFVFIYQKRKKLRGYGLFMIPPYSVEDSYDVSIDTSIQQSAVLSEELVSYSRAHGMSERDAQIVALAGEEIADNIISYGYNKKRRNTIDVNLKIVNDKMVLRIRDDGVVFDPTKYERRSGDAAGGISLIKGLVSKMTYLRVLSLNNTVLEINIAKEN
ncbi:MAG: ATP-binding protein [Clostridia bacterium]|nr:ATP-binding protein [Clostridia bacterium]